MNKKQARQLRDVMVVKLNTIAHNVQGKVYKKQLHIFGIVTFDDIDSLYSAFTDRLGFDALLIKHNAELDDLIDISINASTFPMTLNTGRKFQIKIKITDHIYEDLDYLNMFLNKRIRNLCHGLDIYSRYDSKRTYYLLDVSSIKSQWRKNQRATYFIHANNKEKIERIYTLLKENLPDKEYEMIRKWDLLHTEKKTRYTRMKLYDRKTGRRKKESYYTEIHLRMPIQEYRNEFIEYALSL